MLVSPLDSRCLPLAGECGDALRQPWAASAFCVGEWLAALGFTPPLYHNHRPCQTPKSGPRPLRASAVQPDCSFSPRALCVGAILPQLLEGAVLQDVDVIDLQPGLGRDLVGRPALDIPAVDDVRLALVQLRPGLPHHFAPGFQFQPPRQFSLDVRGTWRDNGPVLPVAACNPHNGDCLNRHTDDALFLPGLVQLEIIPPTPRDLVAAFASTHPPPSTIVCRLGTVTCSPRRAT